MLHTSNSGKLTHFPLHWVYANGHHHQWPSAGMMTPGRYLTAMLEASEGNKNKKWIVREKEYTHIVARTSKMGLNDWQLSTGVYEGDGHPSPHTHMNCLLSLHIHIWTLSPVLFMHKYKILYFTGFWWQLSSVKPFEMIKNVYIYILFTPAVCVQLRLKCQVFKSSITNLPIHCLGEMGSQQMLNLLVSTSHV